MSLQSIDRNNTCAFGDKSSLVFQIPTGQVPSWLPPCWAVLSVLDKPGSSFATNFNCREFCKDLHLTSGTNWVFFQFFFVNFQQTDSTAADMDSMLYHSEINAVIPQINKTDLAIVLPPDTRSLKTTNTKKTTNKFLSRELWTQRPCWLFNLTVLQAGSLIPWESLKPLRAYVELQLFP